MASWNHIVEDIVVSSPSRNPVSGLRVEAWDEDLLIDDLVGNAVTDEEGPFDIQYTSDQFARKKIGPTSPSTS